MAMLIVSMVNVFAKRVFLDVMQRDAMIKKHVMNHILFSIVAQKEVPMIQMRIVKIGEEKYVPRIINVG